MTTWLPRLQRYAYSTHDLYLDRLADPRSLRDYEVIDALNVSLTGDPQNVLHLDICDIILEYDKAIAEGFKIMHDRMLKSIRWAWLARSSPNMVWDHIITPLQQQGYSVWTHNRQMMRVTPRRHLDLAVIRTEMWLDDEIWLTRRKKGMWKHSKRHRRLFKKYSLASHIHDLLNHDSPNARYLRSRRWFTFSWIM